MRHHTPFVLVLAAIALVTVVPVPVRSEGPVPVFEVTHPELRAALRRIEQGSASWRAAMAAVAAVGRRAYLLTSAQVVVKDRESGHTAPFDRAVVAEVSPVADEVGNVAAVVVVVNLERMQRLHELRGSLPAEFNADLDRVLAHEVYGHAVPYLVAGHLSGQCADPVPNQPAAEACAIKRENVVRRELRLGRRTDAALGSLTLAWLGSR